MIDDADGFCREIDDGNSVGIAVRTAAGSRIGDKGELAAYVCSQPGGTPELPKQLRAPFLAA